MAGLDPAIHDAKKTDARVERGHDAITDIVAPS
jgi:hypothetical protein